MINLAANLSMMFNEVDFLYRFSKASSQNFKAVEYLFPYDFSKDNILNELNENNLKQILFDLPAGDWDSGDRGIAVDPERKKEFEDGVHLALEYASVIKPDNLTCLVGKLRQGVSDSQARSMLIENLIYAAEHTAKAGVSLLVEPINTSDIPGYWLCNTDEALSIINEVNNPNLKLQYDIYHMQIMEGNIINTIENNLDVIGHMQLADNPGRHEPGTGELNYPEIFRMIDSMNYSGWIGCEYIPISDTESGLAWARDFLN
ncbi:MAG: hydroxypyruvate isomerase [Actinobacteria bacterium]|nr:hydroxypyruvate isomerase [Actinomycetota bacterium]|tara:strand:- start:328 stop:1107 length:780 start_codon:yes stop_codon:yes gene_type:complete